VAKLPILRMEIVVQPRRWVVERTFSWIGRKRLLAKDYENRSQPPSPPS
jgi:transposase